MYSRHWCLGPRAKDAQVADAMYGQGLASGFAVPPLIRFVGAEDAYLVSIGAQCSLLPQS